MLKKIVTVKGVGLFHDSGASPPFGQVAMIFGENGRGKSTLATILRSCGDGQAAALSARATLGGTLAQSVQLEFVNTAGASDMVSLISAAWSKPMPNLRVFDADFVSKNVYAGGEISTDQRASLLEFALGENSVTLRKKVDDAAQKLTDATGKMNTQMAVLKAHAGAMAIDAFSNLTVPPNADEQIALLEKRIAAANAREEIFKKKVPVQVALPVFNATSLFSILAKSLPEVESTAEQEVRNQIKRCTHPKFEQWLMQGSAFDIGYECPYCGSSIKDNNLIKAYRTHFNKAYEDLKVEAARLEDQVNLRLGDAVAVRLEQAFETVQAHIDGWEGFVEAPSIAFCAQEMRAILAQLRTLIEPLAKSKGLQPLESVGSADELNQAATLWASAIDLVSTANSRVLDAATAIEAYKGSLATEDVKSLRNMIDDLKLRKLRHTPMVVAEFQKFNQLSAEKKARSDEKEETRKALDILMTTILSTYQTEINTLLAGFGTQVRIEALSFDYRGGVGLPRSNYQLKVRGLDVKLAGDKIAAFGNALSEGDKRALAFAFFIARLHQDPQLADRIIVIDDPMCSLDRRRRTATIRVLKALATKCKQLIVLAHDPYFLQALDDELKKLPLAKNFGALSYCKIVPATNDYSTFADLVLAKECSSQYENDLAVLTNYADAKQGLDRGHVAKCLRVVLETSLHQQFPSLIPRNAMLGQVITSIEKSTAPSPLASLHPTVPELRALNDYAKRFHHADDGSPPDVTTIDEGELHGYCVRVLAFVLRG